MQTRREMQPAVRSEVLDAIERLGRIDAHIRGGIEKSLSDEGVQGDVIDINAAIRKLHSIGCVFFSHPIVEVPTDDGKMYHERRHVLTFVYRTTSL